MARLLAQAYRNHKYGALGRHWDRRKEAYQITFGMIAFFLMMGIVGEMDYQDALLKEKYREHVIMHGSAAKFDPANH